MHLFTRHYPNEAYTQMPLSPARAAMTALPLALWRRRWIVIYSLAAGMLICAIYLLVATRTYTAQAKLYVQRVAPTLSDQRSSFVPGNYLRTQVELIRSTPIAALALGMPGVEEMRTFNGVSNKIQHLRELLQVELGTTDDFITISLQLPYRDEAERLVEGVVVSYVQYHENQRRDNTTSAVELLQRERDRREQELRDKSREMMALKEKAQTLSFESDRNNLVLQRLQSLADALTVAHLATLDAKANYEQASLVLADRPELLDDVERQGVSVTGSDEELLRAELFSLQQRLQDRLRRYGPGHPQVQEVNARIEQLRLATAGAAKRRWMAAQQKEADLRRSFEEQQRLAIQSSAVASEHARLAADARRLESSISDFDAQIKEITLAASSNALNITVAEPAHVDPTPTSPRPWSAAGTWLGLGLLVGLLLAAVKELIDPRVRSADDVRGALGMPLVGLVPHMDDRKSAAAHGWCVHLEPKSDAAEGFRSIRTSLHYATTQGSSRTIAVTSPSPREGKSTLASNVAMAIAKAGKTVLLVDANVRTPSQHRIFSVSDDVGFSTALAAREIVGAIKRTTIERLHIMPAGPGLGDITQLLNSPALGDLLQQMTAKYEHVVIDTPSVLACDDARIIAASCDLTLLVVRVEQSNRNHAARARDALLSVGAGIFGVVLNDASAAASPAHRSSPMWRPQRSASAPVVADPDADELPLPH